MKDNLSSAIKEICLKEGFFKVGFAKYEKLSEEAEHLQKWINEGRNADMDWIARNIDKREDASMILNGIISVISLSYIYDTPFEHKDYLPKISRYAWGKEDYHKVLKKKLKVVCKEIENYVDDVKTKFYVDDGPVMEKAWAVRSGLGWMGKHGNVIDAGSGSFFFLSEILINKELDYDKPVDDLCDTCRVCIEACPTGAIYEEYKVDANLCISYQTIENKHEIPSNIDLSGWIFGCDVCQDVCPFNRRNIFTEEKSFYPMTEVYGKSAEELSGMNEDEFNKVFADSPVRRTKFTGWKRNLNRV